MIFLMVLHFILLIFVSSLGERWEAPRGHASWYLESGEVRLQGGLRIEGHEFKSLRIYLELWGGANVVPDGYSGSGQNRPRVTRVARLPQLPIPLYKKKKKNSLSHWMHCGIVGQLQRKILDKPHISIGWHLVHRALGFITALNI